MKFDLNDPKQLEEALMRMQPRQMLYITVKRALKVRKRWKDKPRGKHAKNNR